MSTVLKMNSVSFKVNDYSLFLLFGWVQACSANSNVVWQTFACMAYRKNNMAGTRKMGNLVNKREYLYIYFIIVPMWTIFLFMWINIGSTGGLKTSTSHKHLFAFQCNENQPLLQHQLPSKNQLLLTLKTFLTWCNLIMYIVSESSALHQQHKEHYSEHTSVQNMSAAGFSTTASSHYGTPTAQSPLHSASKAQTPPFSTTSSKCKTFYQHNMINGLSWLR